MEINGLSSSTAGVTTYIAPTATSEETTTAASAAGTTAAENEQKNEAAVYESSSADKKVYKPDANKIRQMLEENDRQVASFRKLVESLFNKQAQKAGVAFEWKGNKTQIASTENMIEIDDETRAAAKKEIEEGGYYSVDETAKRLLNFAVALSGGDPSKIASLKEATLQGFKEAEKAWGGELPEISQKTYDAVVKGFEEWEKAGSADAISLLAK